MKVKNAWIPIFLAPAVNLFLLIYAVPLVMVFATSLCEYKLTSKSITFIGLQNYIDLFKDPAFHTAFTNTIIWILIHCILHVAMGCLIALLLYKKPRGWKVIRTAYMVPTIISNDAMGMIFVNIFNPQFGVGNSILKMVSLAEVTNKWLMATPRACSTVT